MENILYQIFRADYDRASLEDNVLKPIFRESAKSFTLYDKAGEQEIQLTETEMRTAKKVVKYGEFITQDDRKVELYEVTVEDFNKVKVARVGLGALVKKLIIGNNAVFATFKYENTTNKHWRFSFIAYDSFFQDGQVQSTETNPKRYTYVFGDKDETYRTAIDRFLELENKTKIKVKDIQEAFAVEAMSKEFFDEYREVHYAKFVKYLTGEEFIRKGSKYELIEKQKPSVFLKSVFNGNKVAARDFVKKLLGQIVFLYFLQKKGWLGSPTGDYKSGDGDKNFMLNFFNQAGANDAFYTLWLTKLFYDTLNKERKNDDFEMPDGSIVKIPFLNGGLFDKETDKYDYLTFPKELFTDLFEFFNRFNFTIYENSPEEHTVAVDPEMLGHIFENLLEDNKDKGTFYTPKEIVHYMTQESLIEYLITHLGENDKEAIELFVRDKNKEGLTDTQLNKINELLDKVKICDPAIGSGAFPMGLLQEIFSLKENIAFELEDVNWNPAEVKENIIQNSIYGVDIEKGAVDIAKLRFWLSLIVDADVPKALPNLAYKIVVGNSLVSKFEEEIIEIDWEIDDGEQFDLFGNPYVEELQQLLKKISEKQKTYFSAKIEEKQNLAKEIRNLKLDILSTQLKVMIETKGKGIGEQTNKRKTKKQLELFLEVKGWKNALSKIERLKTDNQDFSHFDWALDFPEILNPLVIEDEDKRGFDIVIGNPPYIKEYRNRKAFDGFRNSPYYQGKMDLWYGFACVCIDLLKENGIECFIAQNNWITSSGASIFRNKVLNETEVKLFTDFWNYKVFKTAGIQTMIYLLKKKKPAEVYELKYSVLKDDNIEELDLASFLEFDSEQYFSEKFTLNFQKDLFVDTLITFNNPKIDNILNRILNNDFQILNDDEVAQGIVFPQDKLNRKNAELLGEKFSINDGIFLLTKNELESLSLLEEELNLIKPYYSTKELLKYYGNSDNSEWIIYTKSDIKDNISNYPNVKEHIDRFAKIITSDNKPYGLHRARNEEFFIGEKIISVRKNFEPTFTYTDFDCYVTQTFYSIKSERFNLKYLTTLFNSKLIAFWLRYRGKMQGNNYQVDKAPLLEIPIIQPSEGIEKFTVLLDYLLFLLNPKNDAVINHTSNERIASHIQDVLDMMVCELYFQSEMLESHLSVLELISPKPIENLSNIEDKAETIKAFYLWLQKPENAVRQRILLTDTRSKNLISVINKSV